MHSQQESELPADWGKDALSKFLVVAGRNVLATHADLQGRWALLSEIYECFAAGNGARYRAGYDVAASLFARAQGAFVAAAGLAAAGFQAETFVMVRNLLEHGLYGLHCAEDAHGAKIWRERDQSNDRLRAAIKWFKPSKLLERSRCIDAQTRDDFEKLYNHSISQGAHPNIGALTRTRDDTRSAEVTHVSIRLLSADHGQIDDCLAVVERAGLLVIKLHLAALQHSKLEAAPE